VEPGEYQVQRLRTSGALPPLALYAFTASIRTALPFITYEVGENYVMRSFVTFIPSNITVTIRTRRPRWAVRSSRMGR
jgi:hypothetical protein